MVEFERIHHVSLVVRELEKAQNFYKDVLGFQEIERPPFNSKGIWYAIGDQQLHLIEQPTGKTFRTDGSVDSGDGHFAIWVKSYKETISWLEESGIAYKDNPQSVAGFSQIYIVDVDNNVIEFDAAYDS